jgi:CRP-like cAMP-binding protein
MTVSSLGELGQDLLLDGNIERALGAFSECVRRQPADHRSRMLAARCFEKLGERERAVTVLHACAEGLLRRDYLLSAIAACRQALTLAPKERRLQETLVRIHSRAAKNMLGKAAVPPPMPPSSIFDGKVETDLMGLSGALLSDMALEVLAAPDESTVPDNAVRPPLPLFADLERDAFVELVECCVYRELEEGEAICTEGEGGDTVFVLVAGKAEVTKRLTGEKPLAFLGGGSIFGDLSMLTGTPPTSTVRAVGPAEVFEIRREHLNQLARHHPSVPKTLTSFAQQRMARNLTNASPMFAAIPEAERASVASSFEFKAVMPHDQVIVEGAQVAGLFVVLAGELVVQKEDPAGGVVSLGILRDGDVAGEIALLKGLRATATVSATRKTATAFMPRQAFFEVLQRYPQVQTFLEGLSEHRLKVLGEVVRPVEVMDADELVLE